MLDRHLTPALHEALSDTPVTMLVGPRQSGKSTLAQALVVELGEARYVSLDRGLNLTAARDDPAAFIAGDARTLVIDEVQRAPDLLLAIKASVDEDRRPGRFVLTGSADVLSLPRVADTLAGRMEVLRLWPLSQGEIEGRRESFLELLLAGEQQLEKAFAAPFDLPLREGPQAQHLHAAGERVGDARQAEHVRRAGEDEAAGATVLVDARLDREQQVGRSLHLVNDQRARIAGDEGGRVVTGRGEVQATIQAHVAGLAELDDEGLRERALAALPRPDEHRDRRIAQGLMQGRCEVPIQHSCRLTT